MSAVVMVKAKILKNTQQKKSPNNNKTKNPKPREPEKTLNNSWKKNLLHIYYSIGREKKKSANAFLEENALISIHSKQQG